MGEITITVDSTKLEDLLRKIDSEANQQASCIYNIVTRSAGWAVQFYEEPRQGQSNDFRAGLVVYRYFSTLSEALNAELHRLKHGDYPEITGKENEWPAHILSGQV